MTQARAKQILEKYGRKYTDAEVSALCEILGKLADIQLDILIKKRNESNHIYKGEH